MKDGWQTRQLGTLAELKGRIGWRGLTAKEYTKSGPLFLSVHSLNYGDYVDFRDAFHISEQRYAESPEIMLREGDVLICKDGAGIGKVGIVGSLPDRTTINSSLLLIRSGKEILPKFLYRCLCSPYFQEIVSSRLNGATTPHLYQRDITEFPVVLPPLPEQQRIVAVLDRAFDEIGIAKRSAKQNLQNSRALFESYLQSIFTARHSGWCDKPLAELCESSRIITYGVIKLGDEVADGVPCLRTSNVRWLRIETEGMKRIATSLSSEYSRTILKGGEVLVNVRGTLGGVAVATPEMAGWNVSREVAVVPVNAGSINPYFLSYFIGSGTCQQWLGDVKKGAAYVGINIEDLRLLPVSAPGLDEQSNVVGRLEAFQKESLHLAELYTRKVAALDALKDCLLHRAFSGQLTACTTSALVDAVA
jgi:type I restriction enzyme, S subunit